MMHFTLDDNQNVVAAKNSIFYWDMYNPSHLEINPDALDSHEKEILVGMAKEFIDSINIINFNVSSKIAIDSGIINVWAEEK